MELNKIQNINPENGVVSNTKIISPKEAQRYFDDGINQEQIEVVTNNLIGIVDNVLNTYVNSFRG